MGKYKTIVALLVEIRQLILAQTKGEAKMAADLTALETQVASSVTIETSAVTLIQGIAAQLASIATDPVAVAKMASDLSASATTLSAAIVANTK